MEHFEIDGWFISPDDTVFGTTVDLVRLGQPSLALNVSFIPGADGNWEAVTYSLTSFMY